jgi:hypothetical protein
MIIKVFNFLKKNWSFIILIVFALYHFNQIQNIKKVIEITQNSYEKQISAIEQIHQKEIKQREQLLSQYKESSEELVKKYKYLLEILDNKKKQKIEIIKNEKDDDLAKRITKEFGFEYVSEDK